MESMEQMIDTVETMPESMVQRPRVARVKPRVLVADDDPHARALITLALRRSGFRVVEAIDGMEAIEHVAASGERASSFSAMVVDVCMPGLSGLDVLTVLRCASVETPVILVTAFADQDVRAEARQLGAEVFAKPLDIAALASAVAMTVWRPRARLLV